mmetsp:Transcript_65738/g.105969  ORF Transcript_65738/g.105969 Transcript_65738/m.105969 type:complete len:241 (+) Transcript_65738:218-940(+)
MSPPAAVSHLFLTTSRNFGQGGRPVDTCGVATRKKNNLDWALGCLQPVPYQRKSDGGICSTDQRNHGVHVPTGTRRPVDGHYLVALEDPHSLSPFYENLLIEIGHAAAWHDLSHSYPWTVWKLPQLHAERLGDTDIKRHLTARGVAAASPPFILAEGTPCSPPAFPVGQAKTCHSSKSKQRQSRPARDSRFGSTSSWDAELMSCSAPYQWQSGCWLHQWSKEHGSLAKQAVQDVRLARCG